ncbi:helix-turn-helix domain-containing protein [Nonomuraea cavernae]|uniref:helix-turn-helix domain-containing protein n=1 Tax=Nonomuraea cavernae TaxID=2045107 RepID=UPI0034023D70
MLEAIGLSPTESHLYSTLVDQPRSTAGELAACCGLSTAAVARMLATFARRGLANRLPGRRARYVAISPDVAFKPMLALREEELNQARSAVHDLTSSFHRATRNTVHPGEQIEVITGAENILSRAYAIQDSAQAVFRVMERPPFVMSVLNSNEDRERQMLLAGIDYRSLYDQETLTLPGKLDTIWAACAAGEQARVLPTVPLKLWMADEALALVPVFNGVNGINAAFVVHRSTLLDALLALFELEWKRASPLRAAPKPASPDNGPAELDRKLVGLLAAGLTDEVIARSLGLGLRTVQRRIHLLMRDLNAVTRFQAGMAAREHGWI